MKRFIAGVAMALGIMPSGRFFSTPMLYGRRENRRTVAQDKRQARKRRNKKR